ncbi:hypothetical protein ACFWUP_01260 [Nocardia sp. NPDC058658]|uniref:hypothetical protein n=1 Tax=Nocardia sp. NPDC058658 TaxID=3346580 RepID=UPI0036539F8B
MSHPVRRPGDIVTNIAIRACLLGFRSTGSSFGNDVASVIVGDVQRFAGDPITEEHHE